MKRNSAARRMIAGARGIACALFASALLLSGCNKNPDPDAEPTLSISPASERIAFEAEPTESYTFKVNTNQPLWLVHSDQDWCKVAMDTEAMTFTVTALPNTQPTPPPPATITISAGKAGKLTIAATQAAAEPEAEPTLSITPESETITFDTEPTEGYTFTVTTNQAEWAARSDQDWCKVAMDAEAMTFTVTALPNAQPVSPPPATITVSAGKAKELTITATQAAVGYDVYIGGDYTKDDNTSIVCYWKNGERIDVSDGTGLSACRAFTVSDGTVYLAGDYNKYYPSYWRDKERFELEGDGSIWGNMDVENGTVYVLGWDCYWKDGAAIPLDIPGLMNKALVVSGGTVHIAGDQSTEAGYLAACWTEAAGTDLLATPAGTTRSKALCAAGSGGSIYIGGWYEDAASEDRKPCYWKDGALEAFDLAPGMTDGVVVALCVEQGRVYAAGWQQNNDTYLDEPCYWTDGKRVSLEVSADMTEVQVTGIAAVGEMVYVSGYYGTSQRDNYVACYWLNGKRTDLQAEAGVERAQALGIALVRR